MGQNEVSDQDLDEKTLGSTTSGDGNDVIRVPFEDLNTTHLRGVFLLWFIGTSLSIIVIIFEIIYKILFE